MALASIVGKVMFVVVMVGTAYGWEVPADYPDLAGKMNYSVLGIQIVGTSRNPCLGESAGDLRPLLETTRFAMRLSVTNLQSRIE
jgi:hypothetical protein